MQYLGHHLAATENVLSELENWMEHYAMAIVKSVFA